MRWLKSRISWYWRFFYDSLLKYMTITQNLCYCRKIYAWNHRCRTYAFNYLLQLGISFHLPCVSQINSLWIAPITLVDWLLASSIDWPKTVICLHCSCCCYDKDELGESENTCGFWSKKISSGVKNEVHILLY